MKFFLYGILACSCFQLQARGRNEYTYGAIDELRLEVADVKHALKSVQVELDILDERARKHDTSLSALKSQPISHAPKEQTSPSIERKLAQLEKCIDKALEDLRALNTYTNQTLAKVQDLERQMQAHDKQLSEVSKLKGTLTSISQAISAKPAADQSSKTYRVKAGDSLEKIARNLKTTPDTLRKLNRLTSDKILIGQELRIADDTP